MYVLHVYFENIALMQVLLVASSFMTPLEARNGTNRTAVRMFDSSKMSANMVKEKWDRVKIVCTQPFNKVGSMTHIILYISQAVASSCAALLLQLKTKCNEMGYQKIKYVLLLHTCAHV